MNRASWPYASIFAIILLVTWHITSVLKMYPDYLMPSPLNVLQDIWINRNTIWANMSVTTVEAFYGLLIAVVFGISVGSMMSEIRLFREITLPYIVASNAIPIVAISPLIILWFGHGLTARAIVAAFLSFFPLTIATYRGMSNYPSDYEHLFNLYNASRWKFFVRFKVRYGMPVILTGYKLSAVFAVVGAIIAEFIGSDSGLGFGLLQASYSLNSKRLLSYIIASAFLGLLFYASGILAEKILTVQDEHSYDINL
jgi:ABC-type nitrate/sulfonate/bicarbonate transport system permease component